LRIGGAGAAAALTIAVCAASASALTAPEYGRCVHVSVAKTGTYADAACKTTAGRKAHEYEWLAPEHPGFTLALKPGSKLTIQRPGGHKIQCASAHGSGQIVSSTRAHIDQEALTFDGCHVGATTCTGRFQEAGVIANREGINDTLLEIMSPKEEVGTQAEDSGAGDFQIVEMTCPGDPLLSSETLIDGKLIGIPTQGKMSMSTTVKYTAPHGVQTGGNSFKLCYSGTCETIGVTMTLVRTYEEPIEIRPPV
jgi:hypothetical protein